DCPRAGRGRDRRRFAVRRLLAYPRRGAALATMVATGRPIDGVGRSDSAIPRKYRELMALAVACTTQCPYCIEVHTKAAKTAGATRAEVVESAFLAAALRAGGAATHGAMALKFFNQEYAHRITES